MGDGEDLKLYETPTLTNERYDSRVDRISELPNEILFGILSFLRLRRAAATTVLSSRWLDLWKQIPHLKSDRISQLPDQLLLVIVSCLPLKEAVATSVLSSRWSDLWKHTPNLNFNAFELDAHLSPRCIVEIVNSVIQLHKAISLKQFRVLLYVNKSAKCSVTKWLEFVFSRQVESLELDFLTYTDSNKVVLEESLREMSVACGGPQTLVFFQSLKRLHLRSMILSGKVIKMFLRNCPLLEELMICTSVLTSHVQVSAPNLTSIGLSPSLGKLVFRDVPKLVDAYFMDRSSAVVAQHFALISQLQILSFCFRDSEVFFTSRFPEMPKLKKLVIWCNRVRHPSLLPLTSLIWASPRLQELKLMLNSTLIDRSAPEDIANVGRSPHQHLRLFEIQHGHNDRVVELATYILDNCVALGKILIHHPSDAYVDELGEREDYLKQQLQGKLPMFTWDFHPLGHQSYFLIILGGYL